LLQVLELHRDSSVRSADKLSKPFRQITTNDEAFIKILQEVELHAGSDIPILITGETGVGKELLARAIHQASLRANGAFLGINMMTLPAHLFESEFFGHAKGAFTGAERDRQGYLAAANGGTIFLDEIGDMSWDMQGKLLRILQEEEYMPVGSTKMVKSNVRFVAATNRDLDYLMEQNRFRKDLYYRLQFARISVPPLRKRLGDIQILASSHPEIAVFSPWRFPAWPKKVG